MPRSFAFARPHLAGSLLVATLMPVMGLAPSWRAPTR